MLRRRLRAGLAAAVTGLLAVAAPATAAPLPGIDLGYLDPKVGFRSDDVLFAEMQRDGSQWARISLHWAWWVHGRPNDPADPNDPAYDFSSIDRQVQGARAHGQRVLVSILEAPGWAEGPGRAPDAGAGTWRPDPRELGLFAQAVARRYGGAVDAYQVWNEPNLAEWLTPQWEARDGRLVPASPGVYRGMLNEAYRQIKAVDPSALVLTAGLSPYGQPPGGIRLAPVTFWRSLLAEPTWFDAAAHHPYQYFGPTYSAVSPDDAGVPDLRRITRVIDAGRLRGTVRPAGPKPMWVTEWSWESAPADPLGVPADVHARWLEYGLFELWRQHVATVLWYQVRDEASGDTRASFQSGTYSADGTPKPAARAFLFPFVTAPEPRGRAVRAFGRSRAGVQLWGRAPAGGRLVVERLAAGPHWRTILRLRVARHEVFLRRGLRLPAGTVLRARVGDVASLPWTVARERVR